MGEQTNIEWCDRTWGPWEGCTKVSPGCANCYAAARNARFKGDNWGKGAPRRRTVDWKKPLAWNKAAATAARRPRVFPSLCDVFDEEVPIKSLADFLRLLHGTPNLDWLLLTKRPQNCESRLNSALETVFNGAGGTEFYFWLERWRDGVKSPSNVWLGVSVEDQARADERIPKLLQIPARVRFLSVEPMLGPVDLRFSAFNGAASFRSLDGIHWVIVGGESGPCARPCNAEWIRDIVRQCAAAGVPCFVKQAGACSMTNTCWCGQNRDGSWKGPAACWNCGGIKHYKHPKGGDPAEWPADLRVRQFPEVKP